ncbi:MAG: histidine--tRNA ligase [Candidatus Eisenbacteria bacterium]
MEPGTNRVKPEVAGGFRDYLPGETLQRQWMIDTIRGVFELHGFSPISTPCVEREEVLTGGDPNFKMQIFRIAEKEVPLALRFDLTVPLARFIASHPQDLVIPFRRYQVAPVWRGEKPQAGRYCEFLQFDADTVGSDTMLADAETIALIDSVLRALLSGERYTIRVNDRKILNALPAFCGFPADRINDVLRVLDKIDKIGWKGVAAELAKKPENEWDEVALAMEPSSIEKIHEFLSIRGQGHEDVLDEVERLVGDEPNGKAGVAELREVVRYVRALGVSDENWCIDLSVARGLGYYTGPVFEASVDAAADLGSVFSGGRYDGLVNRFSPAEYGATGASVGVDRLFAVLEKLGKLPGTKSVSKVLIARFDPALDERYLRIAAKLRAANIATELYMGGDPTLKGQLGYGLKLGVGFLIIMGPDEAAKGVVQVKDLDARKQVEVAEEDVVLHLTEKLGSE